MNAKRELSIRFSCTDRLNENKSLEMKLGYELNSKLNNELLIDKLKEFQAESNSLMSILVENEKEAIAAKLLAPVQNKKLDQPDSDQDSDEVEEDDAEVVDEKEERLLKKKSHIVNNKNLKLEPCEKKLCL